MINSLTELYTNILLLDVSEYLLKLELMDFMAMKFDSGYYVFCNSVDGRLFNPAITKELYDLLMANFRFYTDDAVQFQPVELSELIVMLRFNKLSRI